MGVPKTWLIGPGTIVNPIPEFEGRKNIVEGGGQGRVDCSIGNYH